MQMFSPTHLIQTKRKTSASTSSEADLSWMCLKDSVRPGFMYIWSGERLGLEACWWTIDPRQLLSVAKAATGDLFSQVLFGNSVWGLGAAGSF